MHTLWALYSNGKITYVKHIYFSFFFPCEWRESEQSECSMKSFLTLFLTALIDGQHYPFKHRLPLTFTTRAGFKWHLRALVSQKGTMTMTMTTGSERLIWRFPSTGPGEQYMENSLCTATSCFLSFPPPFPPPRGPSTTLSTATARTLGHLYQWPLLNCESIKHMDIFTCVSDWHFSPY